MPDTNTVTPQSTTNYQQALEEARRHQQELRETHQKQYQGIKSQIEESKSIDQERNIPGKSLLEQVPDAQHPSTFIVDDLKDDPELQALAQQPFDDTIADDEEIQGKLQDSSDRAVEEELGLGGYSDDPEEQSTIAENILQALAVPGQRSRSFLLQYGYGRAGLEDKASNVPPYVTTDDFLYELFGIKDPSEEFEQTPLGIFKPDPNKPILPQIQERLRTTATRFASDVGYAATWFGTEMATDPLTYAAGGILTAMKAGAKSTTAFGAWMYGKLLNWMKTKSRGKLRKTVEDVEKTIQKAVKQEEKAQAGDSEIIGKDELDELMQESGEVEIREAVETVSREQLHASKIEEIDEARRRTARAINDAKPTSREKIFEEAFNKIQPEGTYWTVEDFRMMGLNRALNSPDLMAQAIVNAQEVNKLRSISSQYTHSLSNTDYKVFTNQLATVMELIGSSRGVASEAGRAFKLRQDALLKGSERVAKDLDMLFDSGELDPATLAHHISLLDDPFTLAKALGDTHQHGLLGAYVEMVVMGLLSNPVTLLAVNTAGNTIATVMLFSERVAASIIGKDVPITEAYSAIHGLGAMFGSTLKAGWKAFITETPQFGGKAKLELSRAPQIERSNLGVKNKFLGVAIDWGGHLFRLPGKLLLATDEIYKGVNFSMELYAQAGRLAIKQADSLKLEGAARKTFIKKQRDQIVREPDLYPGILRKSQNQAELSTFTNDLGEFGEELVSLASHHPALRLLVPFIRTPINIFKFTFERLPGLQVFSKRMQLELNSKNPAVRQAAHGKLAWSSMAAGQIAYLVSQGRITGQGPDDPRLREAKKKTGWRPNTISQDTDGDGIPDTFLQINRLDPLGAQIGAIADFYEVGGYLDDEGVAKFSVAMSLAIASMAADKTFVAHTAQLGELVTALDDPDRFSAMVHRLAPTYLLPFSAGMKFASRLIDPAIREPQTLLESLAASIPGGYDEKILQNPSVQAASEVLGLEPFTDSASISRDLLGNIEVWDHGWSPKWMPNWVGSLSSALNPIRANQPKKPRDVFIFNELVQNEIFVARPARKIKGIELTNRQYDRYQELIGGGGGKKAVKSTATTFAEMIKEIAEAEKAASQGKTPKRSLSPLGDQLAKIMKQRSWKRKLTPGREGTRAKLIHALVDARRSAAQAILLKEYADLKQKIVDREKELVKKGSKLESTPAQRSLGGTPIPFPGTTSVDQLTIGGTP